MPEVHEEELVVEKNSTTEGSSENYAVPALFFLLFCSIIYFFYRILSQDPKAPVPPGMVSYIKIFLLPYIFVFALIVLIILLLVFKKNDPTVKKENIFDFPPLLLGAFAIFFYVGVEVISYDTFAAFGEHLGFMLSAPDIQVHIPILNINFGFPAFNAAKNFATYTGFSLLAGYIFSIVTIPRFISQQKALLFMTLLSMAFVVLSVMTMGKTAVVCFMLLGFSNAVMWPAIWPLAIDGLGKFTKIGSALLIMGIVGGAILTPLYGRVAEIIDNKQIAYLIMIPAYLYILYYALAGHNVGREKQ
jgi:fucose permease